MEYNLNFYFEGRNNLIIYLVLQNLDLAVSKVEQQGC